MELLFHFWSFWYPTKDGVLIQCFKTTFSDCYTLKLYLSIFWNDIFTKLIANFIPKLKYEVKFIVWLLYPQEMVQVGANDSEQDQNLKNLGVFECLIWLKLNEAYIMQLFNIDCCLLQLCSMSYWRQFMRNIISI